MCCTGVKLVTSAERYIIELTLERHGTISPGQHLTGRKTRRKVFLSRGNTCYAAYRLHTCMVNTEPLLTGCPGMVFTTQTRYRPGLLLQAAASCPALRAPPLGGHWTTRQRARCARVMAMPRSSGAHDSLETVPDCTKNSPGSSIW